MIEVEKELNIYQRLNEVRKKVTYIQKDAKVQSYKAVTHDMVTSEVRPHLIEQGIIIVPRELSGILRDTGKSTSAKTPVTVYVAKYEVDFVNIDDPKDKVTVPIGAIAEDQNDKGPGKAVSYATKYAILKLLSIETGESDESRQDQKPTPISEEQLINLREICESFNFPPDATLAALAKKVYRLKKIEDLAADMFDDAVKKIEGKAKSEAA